MIIFAGTIGDRELHFRQAVLWKNHEILMEEKTLEDFMDYWTQETTYKREQAMLWEKRLDTSAFDIGKRMAYWKRRNPASNGSICTDPSDLATYKDPIKLMAAKQQLRKQGWIWMKVEVNTGTVMKWVKS